MPSAADAWWTKTQSLNSMHLQTPTGSTLLSEGRSTLTRTPLHLASLYHYYEIYKNLQDEGLRANRTLLPRREVICNGGVYPISLHFHQQVLDGFRMTKIFSSGGADDPDIVWLHRNSKKELVGLVISNQPIQASRWSR